MTLRELPTAIALASALTLAACGNDSSEHAQRHYRIEIDGPAQETDRTTFDYSKTVSFTRSQRYKFTVLSGPATPPHFLILNVTQRMGEKSATIDTMGWLPIKSGSGSFECTKYIDVPLDQEAQQPNPTCSFELVGFVDMSGAAVLDK